MTTTDIDIDAIRQREQAATKGPWTGEVYRSVLAGLATSTGNHGADAAFVRHARTDVPALLAKVDELNADIDDRDGEISTLKRDLDLQTKAAWANRSEINHLTALVKVLTAERDDAREHLSLDRHAASTLREREQNALAQLTQSRAQAATYANEIGTLTAENARLRQQRDGQQTVIDAAKAWRAQFGEWGPLDSADTPSGDLTDAVDALPKDGAR